MHAYLISGGNENSIQEQVEKLKTEHQLMLLDYNIKTIESVRNMNFFTNLKAKGPTGILIRNIEKATPQALNAFLKNLEEPQPLLYYIITTADIRLVIPTIVSRCQIIKLGGKEYNSGHNNSSSDFLSKSIGEKLLYIDGIKKREEALELLNSIILNLHPSLAHNSKVKHIAKVLSIAEKTRQALSLNGNIQLHLTNFVINI